MLFGAMPFLLDCLEKGSLGASLVTTAVALGNYSKNKAVKLP